MPRSELTFPETIVCLGCGGVVDPPPGTDPKNPSCHCAQAVAEARSIVCSVCGGPLRVGARSCPHCTSTLATTRCADCFAWNLADAQHCQACGKPLTESELDSRRRPTLACPRCRSQLAARDYLDFAVEECDPCGGLFLAPSMLDRLVKARDQSTGLRLALPKRQRVAETTVRYLECPVCSKPMNRQAFGRISGIVVDLCKLHGVWFDPGELTQVLEFIQNGGLERARIREGEERADELRRLRATQAEAVTLRDLGAQPATVEPDFLRFAQELARSLAELWRAR